RPCSTTGSGGHGTPRRPGRAGCWRPHGGPAGSATTRYSCPTAGAGPAPRSTRRPRTPPPATARRSAPCAPPSNSGPRVRRAARPGELDRRHRYRGGMDRTRLVASDLDGTLLRPDEMVSDRTRAALAAARAAGITVVLVSGRPPRSLGPIA